MPNLLFVDIESTGLDPTKDVVLEIAVYESGSKFLDGVVQATRVYHEVLGFEMQPPELVGYPAGLVFPKSIRLDQVVHEMHTKNNLLYECAQSKVTARSVDEKLCDLYPESEDRKERPILAGSTVHFVRSFLKVHMPRFESRLAHRHLDVSSVKLLCQGLGMSEFKKAEAHRAKEDVEESVAHLNRCIKWLRRN